MRATLAMWGLFKNLPQLARLKQTKSGRHWLFLWAGSSPDSQTSRAPFLFTT